jgi:hypothetical protein
MILHNRHADKISFEKLNSIHFYFSNLIASEDSNILFDSFETDLKIRRFPSPTQMKIREGSPETMLSQIWGTSSLTQKLKRIY